MANHDEEIAALLAQADAIRKQVALESAVDDAAENYVGDPTLENHHKHNRAQEALAEHRGKNRNILTITGDPVAEEEN